MSTWILRAAFLLVAAGVAVSIMVSPASQQPISRSPAGFFVAVILGAIGIERLFASAWARRPVLAGVVAAGLALSGPGVTLMSYGSGTGEPGICAAQPESLHSWTWNVPW